MAKFFVSLDLRTVYAIEAPNHAAAVDAVLDGKGTKVVAAQSSTGTTERDDQDHDRVVLDATD
jgi:hypothetical protein